MRHILINSVLNTASLSILITAEAEQALEDLRKNQPELLRQLLRDPKIGNFRWALYLKV